MDISGYLASCREKIDSFLSEWIPPAAGPHGKIYEAVSYSLFAGGKRIRPILSLAACELVDGSEEQALAGGCAVELIHTYSLLHDDLPCMDDDDFRRGKPSCHRKFDEATAVLAGDALQAMAFELICTRVSPPERAARMAGILARAAGPEGMVGGQILDLLYETRPCSLEELHTLHAMKTGALISAAVALGAASGSCSTDEEERLSRFARTLGLLFQVVDDMLDETGSFEKTGKTSGKDAAAHKSTFVTLMGLEKAAAYRDTLAEKAHKTLDFFGERATILKAITEFIRSRDH